MSPVIVADKDRLQGWKEIAAYLNRDERTVKRWEKQRGLPVRRIPGGGRANVYCLVPELEAWYSADAALVGTPGSYGGSEADLEDDLAGTVLFDSPPGTVVDISPRDLGTEPRADFPEGDFHASNRLRVRPSLILTASVIAFVIALSMLLYRSSKASNTTSASPVPAHPHIESRVGRGAHERYLQGIYFYEQRTPTSLERARQAFEAEIASDPQYAPAYAGLANTYLLLREYSTMASDEAYRRAQAGAEHAIALDPNLPDAHAALGFVYFFYSWKARAAEREFETALRLDPNSALAHHWYGSMLMHETRYGEAMEQLGMAQNLQPSSSAILATKAYALGLSGYRNEATDMLQTLDAREGNTAALHFAIGQLSLMEPRDIPRYLDETRRFAEIKRDGRELSANAVAEAGYRRGGEERMWTDVLRLEQQRRGVDARPTYRMAEFEAALGQDDQAVRDLTTLADARAPQMIGVGLDPLFASLRQRNRLQPVLARMGFIVRPEVKAPQRVSGVM